MNPKNKSTGWNSNMKRVKKNGVFVNEVELLEFVPDIYSFSNKANTMLNQLRTGVSIWGPTEKYREMNLSIWVYDDTRANAFCHYTGEHNYIALSVGLFHSFEKTATEFVNHEGFSQVFKLSDSRKTDILDTLFFYMLNFTVAHEFGHIAHGHLKDGNCGNRIDEMLVTAQDDNDKSRNWLTQLKEYDADSFAAMIQSFLFLQNWDDDIRVNLASFDIMFLSNYLCFRTFAENTERNFDEYFAMDIAAADHPHPGIRMYYTLFHYTYWIGQVRGSEDISEIISSGTHAITAYEKTALEKKEIKACYYSVAFTEKGSQHVMNLHNEWQKLIHRYNEYAYIPIDKLGDMDCLPFSVNEHGVFFSHG